MIPRALGPRLCVDPHLDMPLQLCAPCAVCAEGGSDVLRVFIAQSARGQASLPRMSLFMDHETYKRFRQSPFTVVRRRQRTLTFSDLPDDAVQLVGKACLQKGTLAGTCSFLNLLVVARLVRAMLLSLRVCFLGKVGKGAAPLLVVRRFCVHKLLGDGKAVARNAKLGGRSPIFYVKQLLVAQRAAGGGYYLRRPLGL